MFPKSVTLILYAEAVIACTKYVDCHNNIQQQQQQTFIYNILWYFIVEIICILSYI